LHPRSTAQTAARRVTAQTRRMPAGFHPDTHFFSAHFELAVVLLRFLAVPQLALVPFTTVRIDKRNLLEARVIVTTYNDHVRLPRPGKVGGAKANHQAREKGAE